jgi:cytoskeletal protein CcmA (bactofilin family)
MKPGDNQNPILIPEESILEGFIKTKKSFRIESNFYGTLLSTEKVIIDDSSKVVGDIVCSELLISGNFEGNIFCTGKFSVIGNSKIKGQVFTKLFQNEENCDLNCFIQIPNNEVINAIQDILVNIDSTTKLSTDKNLRKIIQLFKENVYSATDESKKIKKEVPPEIKEKDDSEPIA